MSEYYWIKPPQEGEFEVPVGARVLSRDARRVKVLDDEGRETWVQQTDLLRPMHITSISGVDDMITLGDLQEQAILRNLHVRYFKDVIYTYTGTMLIAVNPYKVLPIYTKEKMALYRTRKIGDLPPHIFAVGDNSYENMRIAERRQCIVISGESGAGKTESTKLILQYLAALSHKHSWIEQQILDSNPIMEAFGNARTVRNDNSSRFGKYMALHFGVEGAIIGAETQQYLLEKSRLVAQNKGERNYHIFYSMLQGLPRDQKSKLELGDASQYHYLNGGETLSCDGRDEAAEWADIMAAMKVLSFSDDDISNVVQLLAAILHLGNLQFKAVTISNMDGSEVIDTKALERVALLLGTTAAKLGPVLTKKVLSAQGDKVTTILSRDQAVETKDAFVKAIYGNLFIYIVDKINKVTKPRQATTDRYIGVLDIFGFENFQNNSFEQLCINLANENLQQFFIHHIFKLEQEQYTNEGVDWKHIQFVDNQSILDMITVKPMNIMSLIDEEAKFPKGTDETMLAKIVAEHGAKVEFFRPKYSGISAFGINHFAGAVFYNVKDFLEKDRDSFSPDLRTIAQTSKNRFLQALFPVENALHTAKKKDTLALKFRQSLDELMGELNQCEPFFVRCIKPNELKKAQIFDRPLCCRQLRYSGMMETAKIRQAGFPIRYTFQEFVERFRVLGRGIPPAHKADCRAATQLICSTVFGAAGEYQVGYTKVFMKTKEDIKLDTDRQRVLSKYVLVLQKNIRGWLCRRRFKKLKRAAIVVQSHWRARKPRQQYLVMALGYRRLQARLRSRLLTYRFMILRNRITALQSNCKGFIIRQWVRQKRQETSGKLRELMELRKREEEQFRKEGKKEWREFAADNWRRRLADLKIAVKEEEIIAPPASFDEDDEEEQTKLVDNIFGFLEDKQMTNSGFSMKDLGIGRGLFKEEDYIGMDGGDIDQEDYSEYNFRKFAAMYFKGNANHMFSRRPLRQALLSSTPGDLDAAARALWITTLRFTYDLPEPRYASEPEQFEAPVMMQITQTLSRKFVKSAAFLDAMAQEKAESRRRRLISMTLKKASKISQEIRQAIMQEDTEDIYSAWLNKCSSNLDKLHFIIGHGILRPELRDEIYAQVCKQLTNNPSKSSFARGWVLLCLCVGCFPPSDVMLNPLKAFLQSGPPGYAQFCLARLKRTAKNGPRSQPPSWVELQAIKFKKSIDVAVILMDGSSKVIQADSATTAQELIVSLAGNIGLKDTFGFGVFVTLDEKVSSLGGGSDHVMDAISQCEQYARENGHSERSAKWRMYLRKEMFAPWHNAASDPVATNLIYEQIVRGLKSGEYRCEKESDLATLAAQQYYIENGLLDKRKLHQSLHSYIPAHIFRTLSDDKHQRWVALIEDAYNKTFHTRFPIETVRGAIVDFARIKWPLMFSRFFEVHELSPNSPLPKSPIVAAINWTGVYFVDQSEQVLLELSYAEIQNASIKQTGNATILNLLTIDGNEMMLQGPGVGELYLMIQELLVELKKRSKYVVVTQDYKPTDGSSFMSLCKGDLIILSDPLIGESLEMNSWGEGRNETSGEIGHFPAECVAVVVSAVRPTTQILNLLKEGPSAVVKNPGRATIQRLRIYTLEKYAAEHFRLAAARRSTISKATALSSVRQNLTEELWRHSREPLKLPLLKRLQTDETLGTLACTAFASMLKYMGDQPTRRQRIGTEYTDRVFEPALRYETLRDEIYCQIMKQLTLNRNKISENRGWELLWLATGMFPCSVELEKELIKFLESRRANLIAEDCLLRFQRTVLSGARTNPPHQVEIEAIQHKHKQIYHRVYFPDDTDEAFEVDSLTRASDLVATIGKRLNLKSCEGLFLFIKVWNKVLSVPEEDYFFDYVRKLTNWIKKNMPGSGETAPQMQYQVYFMRKLWTGGSVGRDRNADIIFHFPQELPKYLRGFHKMSKQDAATLAAYISIAKFGKSTAELQSALTLQQLLPPDMFKVKKPKEWHKEIASIVNKNANLTSDEAKIEFLKIIQHWPTFGSAFFDVKQTTEPNYPEMILVAINRRGIHIVHPVTKDVLALHEYTNISNWSSGNTYFTMTIGAMLRGGGTRLLMETPLGYKMDDLISSYASVMHTASNRRKSLKAPAPPPPDQI